MRKKPIVSVTYESERISIKMCVTSLRSCVVHGPIHGRFGGSLRKHPFLLALRRWGRETSPGAFLWRGFLWQSLYREKTVYIKTHETAINRPVDHTGET